jgi:hypothetical protein
MLDVFVHSARNLKDVNVEEVVSAFQVVQETPAYVGNPAGHGPRGA